MPYQVLLVDDEKRTRVGLTNYIDWDTLGFAHPFVAVDLAEARNILSTEKIDLLITDIRLPDGTGLELCESVRKSHPDMLIFLLSAYGEFEYAQEAIQLGVKHYFTKPTDLQVLSAALADAHKTLEQRFETAQQQARSHQFLMPRLWRDLANGVIQEETSLHTFFSDCGISFPHQQYALFKICVSDTSLSNIESDLVQLLSSMGYPSYPFTNSSYRYVLINIPDIACLQETLLDFLKDSPSGISFHISKTVDSLSLLSKCMVQLLRDPEVLGISEDSQDSDTSTSRKSLLSQMEEDLIESIKSTKRMDSVLLLDKLYQAYAGLPAVKRCDVFTRLLLLIQQYTRHFGITLTSMYGEDFSVSHTAQQLTAPQQMDMWLREHIATIYKMVQNTKNDYSQQMISHIHNYVDTHFAEDISLASVAQLVHLSPYYVSKLFKKTTGENFVDYVTSVRIEKAMEFLSSPSVRVYEVAEQVGYKSTKHFSQVFRSYTGKTPSEYRQIYYRNNEADL